MHDIVATNSHPDGEVFVSPPPSFLQEDIATKAVASTEALQRELAEARELHRQEVAGAASRLAAAEAASAEAADKLRLAK